MSTAYHDHGATLGRCSDARHDLIRAGGLPGDRKSATDHAAFILKWTVKEATGLHCACCRALLIGDPERISALSEDASLAVA